MNQANFLVSSSTKMPRPMKASIDETKNLSQGEEDFVRRLDQATEETQQTTAKQSEPQTEKQGKSASKDNADVSTKLSNEQQSHTEEDIDVDSTQTNSDNEAELLQTNVEELQLKNVDKALLSNSNVDIDTQISSESNIIQKDHIDMQDYSKLDSTDISEVNISDEELALIQSQQLAVVGDASNTRSQNIVDEASVSETEILDEAEEILSQLNSSNRMLKGNNRDLSDDIVVGKELPHQSSQGTTLTHNIAKYEAQGAQDINDFTASIVSDNSALSQLLSNVNANQSNESQEAYISELAKKEGFTEEQLVLLKQAVKKIDITQLQAALNNEKQETAILLENEPVLRDMFIVKMLTEGEGEPELEAILAQLKNDSYEELNKDIDQIPPKLMVELTAYIEAKQVVHEALITQRQIAEREISQANSDAFMLGAGFGAGLAVSELGTRTTDMPNMVNPAAMSDDISITADMYQQARQSSLSKQDIAHWQLQQAQQQMSAESEKLDTSSAKNQIDPSKMMPTNLEQLSNQTPMPSAEKVLMQTPQIPVSKGADFATQLAGMSSATNALQDIQQAGAKVTSQQAIDTPIKLAQHGHVAPELANKVNMMLSRDLKHVDIRLDPPELGKVHIKLALNNDQAHLNFTVSHAHARDAIEHSIPRLREMLAQQGVDLGQANVDQENSQTRDFSGMLADENGGQPSESSESKSVDFINDGDGGKMEVEVTSSISDSAVDFYA